MVPGRQIALGAALARRWGGADASSGWGCGVIKYEVGIRPQMGDGGIRLISGAAAGAFLGPCLRKINGLPLTI